VPIAGMPLDQATFCPLFDGPFVDAEASSRLRVGQVAAIAKPVVA